MKIFFLSLLLTMNVWAGVELPASISHIKKNKVLVFISRTCPCTQQNIPYINELVTEFPDVEFIGVHSVKNANTKMIEEVISEYKPKFTIIDDKDLTIANLLKANRTPQTFLLSPNNDVLYNGGVTNRTNPKTADKLYLHNALAELAQNKPITEKETRSLGCVILR